VSFEKAKEFVTLQSMKELALAIVAATTLKATVEI
jgi:hypothetical protein